MKTRKLSLAFFHTLVLFALLSALPAGAAPLRAAGVTVTPHFALDNMRYLLPTPPAEGARVQLFLVNDQPARQVIDPSMKTIFNGRDPAELLRRRDWAWHDTPSAAPGETIGLDPGEITVWTFNSRVREFGPGGLVRIELGAAGAPGLEAIPIDPPKIWISAITFLGPAASVQPDAMVVHLANQSAAPVAIKYCRLWLPRDPRRPRALAPQPLLADLRPFNGHSSIPAGDRGGFTAATGPLPLTYAVVEVGLDGTDGPVTLWGHLRVKCESFDISGGWVNDEWGSITSEDWLRTLSRLHVNTAHYSGHAGYSDGPLYDRYPLKYNGDLWPPEKFDTDMVLPRVHAVEDQGEPQYGGGRPVPPQEVWQNLHRYASTRLATSLTNSEERIWRDYAGLSDYPHYDAYRVTAPSADEWRFYKWRWQRIGWGAPLETVGDMSRSLRELSRPMPCAYWSQGPHEGWRVFDGRLRTSPTPAEIRSQAWHAVSTRITSLYWFNLRPRALVMFPDTIDELGRIGRELRLLDEFLLEGDAYRHLRRTGPDGRPDWDLASIAGPHAAILFALDLAYRPDPVARVFRFGPPRPSSFRFPLPAYLGDVVDVFRIDADGAREVKWSGQDGAVVVEDQASLVAIYIATADAGLRQALEEERKRLIAVENALDFDPARDAADLKRLKALVKKPFDPRMWISRIVPLTD